MDSTHSSDLECILRSILANALPESASSSNCNDRHQSLLALPFSPDHARATLPHSIKEQDGHCEYNLLPRTAQLNSLADEVASEVLADLQAADQPTEFYPLPVRRVYLRGGTGYITSYEKRTLTNEFPEYKIRAYLQQRNGWTAHTLDSVNWNAYQAALSALTDQVRTFVIKLSHDCLPADCHLPGNAFNSKQYAICTSATLEQIGVTNSS
jgi:hypothetical protein